MKKKNFFENAHVLVIGDIMLDVYYEGDATRISPEAPVPVVNISQKRTLLGGAGNVAKNITSLGAKCSLISLVGNDLAGTRMYTLLKNAKIKPALYKSTEKQSTVKSRIFARNQQMIRFDEETISPILDIEKEYLKEQIKGLLTANTSIIISDYGKGFVYQELIEDIYEIAKEKKLSKPQIIIDPKPQNKAFYHNAFCMTPNAKEASELCGIPTNSKDNILKAGQKIMADLSLENLLITLGAEGMALFSQNEIYHVKSSAKQVFDVTGAGDTVIALMGLSVAQGITLKEACHLATIGAGLVVEKVGSVSITQDELHNAKERTKLETELW